ncbi:MAG: rhomboid family intramembrane serine protease [Thermodesulfobacteriota bacterium]
MVNWLIYFFFNQSDIRIAFYIWRYFYSTPGDQYPWQLITSLFLHADFWHLFGNSIFLWVFGVFVEDKLGWKIYLYLYFLTGVASNLIHGTMVGIFMRENLFIPSLGASGAISGIMGIYLYRCHYSKIKLLISIWLPIRIQVPAVIILVLWFLRDFMGGIDTIRGIHHNVAFWAHVGGFAAGLGTCKYLHYEVQARTEKLEFVADTTLEKTVGYGEGITAAETLLKTDPNNPEMHLKLARAKSRLRATEEGKTHYEKSIRLLLEKDPKKAMEAFIEFWNKYLAVLEPKVQLRLSRLLNKSLYYDLSAHSLQALVDSNHPPDLYMEEAYLSLAKIYETQLEKGDVARYVYNQFLEKFPHSKHREFVERLIRRAPLE